MWLSCPYNDPNYHRSDDIICLIPVHLSVIFIEIR